MTIYYKQMVYAIAYMHMKLVCRVVVHTDSNIYALQLIMHLYILLFVIPRMKYHIMA